MVVDESVCRSLSFSIAARARIASWVCVCVRINFFGSCLENRRSFCWGVGFLSSSRVSGGHIQPDNKIEAHLLEDSKIGMQPIF